MTTVHISLGRDDGTDQTAAKGVVEWEPTTRREDGTMVILERGFVAPLVDGEATVVVDPSGLTWCWRVTERTDSGGTVRYVSVPDSAAVVEYVDLPDVDPTTLQPWAPASPEAAYQAALDNLDVETAVETYLLANPVSVPVTSVNAQTGAVVLGAADVGADPAGTAAGLVGTLVIPDSPGDIGAASAAHTHAPTDITGTAVITTDPRLSDARTPLAHSHTLADVTDAGTAAAEDVEAFAPALTTDQNYVTDAQLVVIGNTSGANTGDEPDASTTVKGIVELATTAEATTGTDTTRAVTPAGVAAAIAGVGGGVTDHGALSGLADDDHTQYALADGSRGAFAATSHTHTAGEVSGLATVATTGAYADLSGKPTLGTAAATDATAYATAAQGALAGTALQPSTAQPINAQTGTTYTLVASDAGKLVTLTNAAAITLTVPADVFTAGQRVDIGQRGAGAVTTVAGSGMTVNPPPGGSLVSEGQYAYWTLLFISATEADVIGMLATP